MAVKKGRPRQHKKTSVASAVRSETQRLTSHAPKAPSPIDPQPMPFKAETGNLSVPEDLLEEAADATENGQFPAVMLVITVGAILFIGVMTWFVARMPAK